MKLLLIFCLIMLAAACNVAKQQPVVILDENYAFISANSWCDLTHCSSRVAVGLKVLEFNEYVKMAFASDRTCRGISLVPYDIRHLKDSVAKVVAAADWRLRFDFHGGRIKQEWVLFDQRRSAKILLQRVLHWLGIRDNATGLPQKPNWFAGTGSPGEIAHAVCVIVNGQGGSLE
ncbi:MAG TPA: hypothetical protein VLV32_04285 [Burkholderiales bacterium]|nr:hypothetical protein [Burkholderiales bacterium]